jgi:hypothetical protein
MQHGWAMMRPESNQFDVQFLSKVATPGVLQQKKHI